MIWINKKLKEMREEDGFTLIELMVVVLIIAILIAIAIPTFLGARGRAQDRAAQSSGRNILTAAKAVFTDNEDYEDATVAKLDADEPSIDSVAANAPSTGANVVSVNGGVVNAATKSTTFFAAVRSEHKEGANNYCWFIVDSAAQGATGGTWWAMSNDGTPANCQADQAPALGNAAYFRTPGEAASNPF